MNIKVAEKKVNSFSLGNPASGLGDAIVGTYSPGGSGRCEQEQPPVDIGGSGGREHGGGGRSIGCGCGCGCCDDKDDIWEIIGKIIGNALKEFVGP